MDSYKPWTLFDTLTSLSYDLDLANIPQAQKQHDDDLGVESMILFHRRDRSRCWKSVWGNWIVCPANFNSACNSPCDVSFLSSLHQVSMDLPARRSFCPLPSRENKNIMSMTTKCSPPPYASCFFSIYINNIHHPSKGQAYSFTRSCLLCLS